MVCANCGGCCGHNKRTCTSPKVTSNQPTRSEKRAAKYLAALLPPPNNKKVSKPLEGLGGCQNIWKEPKSFYVAKKVSKPLEGLGGCQNIWKEPKSFYVAKKVSKPLEDISSCQNIWKEPKDYYTKQKCRENTCATCGGKGHNSRTCLLSPPTVIPSSTSGKKHKKCGICGEFGHNSRTCLLKLPEKKHKKCGICGELGHNARTCNMKCRPCTVQSPAKTECITFANGETIILGLA